MKCLTICQCGHSRSVALVRLLHEKGISAVAIGATTSGDAINTLAWWADRIFVMQPQFSSVVPPQHQHKITVVDVGPDKWANPYHPDLISLLRSKMDGLKL